MSRTCKRRNWSTFEEREAKAMASWLLRIVLCENRMDDLGVN